MALSSLKNALYLGFQSYCHKIICTLPFLAAVAVLCFRQTLPAARKHMFSLAGLTCEKTFLDQQTYQSEHKRIVGIACLKHTYKLLVMLVSN